MGFLHEDCTVAPVPIVTVDRLIALLPVVVRSGSGFRALVPNDTAWWDGMRSSEEVASAF